MKNINDLALGSSPAGTTAEQGRTCFPKREESEILSSGSGHISSVGFLVSPTERLSYGESEGRGA